MRASFSLWPVVIIAAVWGGVAWVGTRGVVDWSLLGLGGIGATALIMLAEGMRLARANRRLRDGGAGADGGSHVWVGSGAGDRTNDAASGGHDSGGDSGGGSSGGDGGGGGGGGD